VRRIAVSLVAALLAAGPSRGDAASTPRKGGARAALVLDGERVEVRWTDGDSFRILSGRLSGRRVRLRGVNALETFGPVHRIGAAGGASLLALARGSAALAAAAGGRCELAARSDRYGRLLADCPEAAAALVRAGHAVVLAVDGPPDPSLVGLQREAQRARAGMWAGGVPPLLPTSVHSAEEAVGPGGAYDRIADTRTGASEARPHANRYRTCEEVCLGAGTDRACLVYVPFERRYRDRPDCLRAR
jgi:endonuclease YncB( thermonuclease family)